MKRRLFLVIMLAATAGALADNVARVTVPGGATTDFATIESALAACSGGETVTLLGDVSVASALSIPKPVILDLDGHTLSNRSGWFIKPTTEANGLVIRNGTVSSADCCIVFENSTSTVYATNVTFRGICTLYGRSAGLVEFQEGCVSRTTFFCSSSSMKGCAINVRGGVVAPGSSIYDRAGVYNTILTVYGGSFTQSPEIWIAADRVVLTESHTVQGITCAYRVREATDADVNACVISADGTQVANYSSFLAAFGGSGNGETVKLFTDVTLAAPIAVTKSVAVDLNGHSLTTTTHLFDMGAGASGFTVMNGLCQAGQSFVTNRSDFSSGTATVSNCTVRAQFFAMGRNGTVSCADDVVTCDFLVSESSSLSVRMTNVTVAVTQAVSAGTAASSASIVLSHGRYSFDATTYLAAGFSQVLEDYDLDGTNCRFKVLPTAEAGTLDAALALSADGTTTNAYATIAAAVSACPAGGTVRLLQSCTVAGELAIPRNMTIDLNGLALRNQSGNFIAPASGVTLTVKDGFIHSPVSLINVNANVSTTVNVTNCTLSGLCPVWGKGTLNLYDSVMWNMSLFGSSNGSATMNVYGGFYAPKKWRDGAANTGTTFNFHWGWVMSNPAELKAGTRVVAAGSRIFYDPRTYNGASYVHAVWPDAETAGWTVEAMYNDVAYTNLSTALSVAQTYGGQVIMASDVTHAVQTAERTGNVWLDLGGHVLAHDADLFVLGKNCAIRASNGSMRELESSKSVVAIRDGSSFTGEASLKIEGTTGKTTCGFYVPGKNASVLLDGTSVSTVRLVSWATTGTDTKFDICGDGTNTCSAMFWPGTSLPTGASLVVRGGWWAINPSSYVTNNHVVLYRAAATPCKWQVKPWAAICADGWSFDFAEEVPTVTGTCNAPSGPITVSLTGTVPTRKTLLADLSGLTLNSGTYADLSFAKDAALPGAVQVSYENGRLYAWEAKGTIIVFK